MYEKTGRLAEEAARVAFKLDARKSKTLGTDCARNKRMEETRSRCYSQKRGPQDWNTRKTTEMGGAL